jgi:hypothetical protein
MIVVADDVSMASKDVFVAAKVVDVAVGDPFTGLSQLIAIPL